MPSVNIYPLNIVLADALLTTDLTTPISSGHIQVSNLSDGSTDQGDGHGKSNFEISLCYHQADRLETCMGLWID